MTDAWKDAVEDRDSDAHIRVEPLVEPDGSPLFILHTDGGPFVMGVSGIARIPMGEVLAIREECTPLNTPSPVSDGLPDGEFATYVYDATTGHHKEVIGADGGPLPA
ncbi:MAG: hypothetical protein R6U20_12400 [Longimonas sp.]|uniref:hypothetical protein n=1 Tax=Longimonas sp. TaxID=2039626 RepID=UPI00397479C7